MTKYLKNKHSFYFTLYHELGHVKSEYNQAKNKCLINNDEEYQDEFSLNNMIDNKIYEEIKKDLSKIKDYSKEYHIPLSFIYSRLAYDKIINYNNKEYINSIEKI